MKKIILSLIVLLPFVVCAQSAGNDTTKYIYYQFTYGNALDRYYAKKVLMLPNDTIYSKDGLAVKNGALYVGNGTSWSLVTGGGTFDSTALNIHSDGFNVAKYKRIIDSGYGMGSNYETIAGSQKRMDSLSGLLGSKFSLADTGYTKTLVSVFLLQKTIDSMKLVNDARYKQIVDSNQTIHSYLSVGRGNKLADSLTILLLAKLDSNQSIHSWASIGRINKIADSLSGLFMRTVDSNQSIHSWASIGRLNKVADSLADIFLATVNVTNSITGDGATNPLKLSGDVATPGANKTYGTDGSGVKGWKSDPTGGGGGSPGGIAKSVQIFSNNGTYFGSVPGFTADSLTHVVSMDTAAIHKAKADSIQLSHPMYATPTGMLVGGDSYSAPSPTRPDGTNAYYYNILASQWGLSVSNIAVSGSGIFNAVYAFNQRTSPVTTLSSFMVDLNDIRTSSGALTYNKIINGWNALYAIQFKKTDIAAGSTGAGFATSGTVVTGKAFNNGTYGGRMANGAYTIVQNSDFTLTATVPSQGGKLYLMVVGSVSNYATWDLYADTVRILQGSSSQRTDGTSVLGHADNFIEYPLIVDFPAGSHSLRLVKTSAAADTLAVDYGGLMQDSSTATPFLMWDQPYLNATGYTIAATAANLLIATTVNTVHDSLFNTLDFRYPIYHVLTNNFWNPLNCLASDSVHPRNYGDLQLAAAGSYYLPYNTPGYFKGVFSLGRSHVEGVIDGRKRVAAFRDETSSKADLAIQKYRASAGAINVSNNTVAMGNSVAGSTLSNSPITVSGNNIGVGQTTPANLIDAKGTHPAIWLTEGTTQSGGLGMFNSVISLGINRNPSTGGFFTSSMASAAIELTAGSGVSQVNFRVGNTNNAAGPVWLSLFPTGHGVVGSQTPSDNTSSWLTNMVWRTDGGLWVNGITNAANKPNVVIQGNGQTIIANAGNTARFAFQVDSNRNALRAGPTNSTFSYVNGYSYWDFATGNFYDSANLYTNGLGTFGNFTDNNGWVNVAANTTTRSSLFLAGASTDVSSPSNGMLWYNSTTDALNFRHGGNTTNLLASGGGGYNQIQVNSSSSGLTQRSKLNFSTAFDVVDNSGNTSTDVSLDNLHTSSASYSGAVGGAVPIGTGVSTSAGGSKLAGAVLFTSSTGSPLGGDAHIVTVTMPSQGGAGYQVFLTPITDASSKLQVFANRIDDTHFAIDLGSGSPALLNSTDYGWSFFLVRN